MEEQVHKPATCYVKHLRKKVSTKVELEYVSVCVHLRVFALVPRFPTR